MSGVIFLISANEISKTGKLDIIDATFACNNVPEKFYEDEKYEYYFPCNKSGSVFVELDNNIKMLVVDALEDGKINIDDLMNSDLEIYKEKK